MKYQMTLGDFGCEMESPSEIKFWIENEIGKYDNKSVKAEKWCHNASAGNIYNDDFIHIEVTN